MKTAATTTIKVAGLLGKPQVVNKKTAIADAILYCEDHKSAYRIRGFGLGLYPQYTPVRAEIEMDESVFYRVKSLTLCPVKSDEYKAFLKKIAHGKAGLKDLEFEVYEVINIYWTEGDDGEDYFYPYPTDPELQEYIKEFGDTVSHLRELVAISEKIFWAEALRKGLADITISQAGLEEMKALGVQGVRRLAGEDVEDIDPVGLQLSNDQPGYVGEVCMKAGLCLADICKLEATGRVPSESVSVPVYLAYLERGAIEGHTVIWSKALWENAYRLIPAEYLERVNVSLDVAMKSTVRATDTVLRSETLGTAYGKLLPQTPFCPPTRYGHIGQIQAVIAEKELARIVKTRHEARREDWRIDPDILRLQAEGMGCSRDQADALAVLLGTIQDMKILTGGPGTGKTTTLKKYLAFFMEAHPDAKIALCAPTGRAAQRMAEQTGRKACTIHRLLEIQPYAGQDLRPTYTDFTPLEVDLLVVDETSMLTAELAYLLLRAVPKHATVLLIGDPAQIQAIGAGAVLRDLMAVPDRYLPKAALTTQHRSGDLVGINAQAVLAGDVSKGVYYTPLYRVFQCNPDQMLSTALATYQGQILAPKYDGPAGIDALNARMQAIKNPGPGVRFGQTYYRPGDPVIFCRNNYELGSCYMNGDMGRVISVRPELIIAELDSGRQVSVQREDAEDIKLAYAISIHKAQGSEFADVTVVLPANAGTMVSRNLLYTAVTRAKKSVTIITELVNWGDAPDTYQMAMAKEEVRRVTLLPMLLAEAFGCHIKGDDALGEDAPYWPQGLSEDTYDGA